MPPDDPNANSTSGVEAPEPKQSIREVAEASYDEISSDVSESPSQESESGQRRDQRGRFAATKPQEPGVAEPERAPSPENRPEATQRPTDPAPQGPSNQTPEHWSAEDRQMYDRLPQDAKAFLSRRHGEMEAEFTRKSQANAGAVQALNALAPIFSDPDIANSLRANQMHPVQAISEWAAFHKRGSNQDPRVRASLLYDLAERMGFDPARVFASNRQQQGPQGVPEAVVRDPNFRYLAEQLNRRDSDFQALRNELQQFQRNEQEKQEGEALRATRWSIDSYADEKGPDGRPLRPYFDRVINYVTDAFRLNPEADLDEAYQRACWQDPEVRKEMLNSHWSRANQQHSNQRAVQAARSNVRGLTSPVSKPAPERKSNGSLRDTLEASADEVGL
jgi:hypothetical protein